MSFNEVVHLTSMISHSFCLRDSGYRHGHTLRWLKAWPQISDGERKFLLVSSDRSLEISGVCVNFNTVWKHPFSQRTDFVTLIEDGLLSGVRLLETDAWRCKQTKEVSDIAGRGGISILKCRAGDSQ